MLILLTCEGPHAPDLGFLLVKHPARVHERDFAHGKLTVFFPEDAPGRATAALLVEVDAVALAKGQGARRAESLAHYVNDRPYVASSFTSVALREAFSSALGGRCKDRPELVTKPLPLKARVPAVRTSAALIARLFEPLGYITTIHTQSLDTRFPSWGESNVVSFEISGEKTVHDLLTHLYVLLPVLDDDKHYFVGESEVEKLLAHGEGWLASHPEKDLIARRYLGHQRTLVKAALSQLTLLDEARDEEEQAREGALEEKVKLADQRVEAVLAALRSAPRPIRRVVDFGCGEGRLLARLAEDRSFAEITGVDVSSLALGRAEKRLKLERRPELEERVKLIQGSLVYDDARLHGRDAIALVEVIEHVEPERLPAVARVLFERLRPGRVVLTTPNREFNVRFETLSQGKFRHDDHRFEWTRAELRAWCEVARPHGYIPQFSDVGPVDPEVGAPTQMAIFDRVSDA